MRQRTAREEFENPDAAYVVMTIAQTGEIRARAAGKGNNPPEWIGAYFSESPGDWFAAKVNDVVFSSIDLWKGCISVVPDGFNEALVTKEFPIYEITDARLTPEFLQTLLRSRFYQRAFRAITTGHSNRRRSQIGDFEALEIAFPPEPESQRQMVASIVQARRGQREAVELLRREMLAFSNLIDSRGVEELPELERDAAEAE